MEILGHASDGRRVVGGAAGEFTRKVFVSCILGYYGTQIVGMHVEHLTVLELGG